MACVSRELILWASWHLVVLTAVLMVQGCMGRYALDRSPVKQISEAERKSRGKDAFERALERVHGVRKGMSSQEVQSILGAVIAHEEGPDGKRGGERKVMDGFLCKMRPMPLKELWIFGFDEGNVQLVSFTVEFERQDADDDDWVAGGVDYSPEQDCPVGGETRLE